jgi:hypothetical protein
MKWSLEEKATSEYLFTKPTSRHIVTIEVLGSLKDSADIKS